MDFVGVQLSTAGSLLAWSHGFFNEHLVCTDLMTCQEQSSTQSLLDTPGPTSGSKVVGLCRLCLELYISVVVV
jgi:hypothetical protein